MRLKDAFSKMGSTSESFDFETFKKRDKKRWKKLKKQFDDGRKIVWLQLNSGIDRLNENVLRLYFHDFSNRFLKYGPNSFPTSFSVLEPFFIFNVHNSVLELIQDEESYGVSLVDFLDFVTEPDFELKKIDFVANIPEKNIYHFTFTTDAEELDFSNSKGKTFVIGGLSLVRQGNQVSMLLQAGESYDIKEAEDYFKKHTREKIENSITSFKKSLGFKLEGNDQPRVVHFLDREDLWLHSVAILFDLETKSIDIRYVARDQNITYNVKTDDFHSFFRRSDSLTKEQIEKEMKYQLDELDKYDAVFDFAKYCLALPYYVFEHEDNLVDVSYETSLNELLSKPSLKREYASINSINKVYTRPFYYLESDSQIAVQSKELDDKSFQVEKSGYWKRLEQNEEGFDKKGRKVIGKTWVERSDAFFTNQKGVTKAIKSELEKFEGKNVGFIYIMREPAHEEGIYKVGLTRREPKVRAKELFNTSSVSGFLVIHKFYTRDCVTAEKLIHKQLDEFRLSSRREFFSCDLKLIMDVSESVVDEINNT